MEQQALIVSIAETIGIIAFAVTGVTAAIERHLDVFGAVVLGCITAVGGGAIRDILLGNLPPVIFETPTYAGLALAVSVGAFFTVYFLGRRLNRHLKRYYQVINLCDALGLGIFCVVGVNTAIMSGYGDHGFLAVFVGTVTGIGGGLLRDVLARRVPRIMVGQIYALPAILGSLLYYYLWTHRISDGAAIWTSVGLVVIMRLLADRFDWHLPRI